MTNSDLLLLFSWFKENIIIIIILNVCVVFFIKYSKLQGAASLHSEGFFC